MGKLVIYSFAVLALLLGIHSADSRDWKKHTA